MLCQWSQCTVLQCNVLYCAALYCYKSAVLTNVVYAVECPNVVPFLLPFLPQGSGQDQVRVQDLDNIRTRHGQARLKEHIVPSCAALNCFALHPRSDMGSREGASMGLAAEELLGV